MEEDYKDMPPLQQTQPPKDEYQTAEEFQISHVPRKGLNMRENTKNEISQPLDHQITSDFKLCVPIDLVKNVPPVRKQIKDII
jgi:hypothetical protein